VGNQSNDLQSTGGYGSNINLVPVGAMLSAVNPSLANANNYRPYLGYGDINRATNNLYSNYNAFQLTWAHQDSHAIIQLNYTLGKSLGIVASGGGGLLNSLNTNLDPFNLRNNYGVQQGDRRHIFSAAYSVNLPSPVRNSKVLSGVVNGWQLSGSTQIQSGANLTGVSTNRNFNMNLNNAIIPGTQGVVNSTGTTGITITNSSLLGTNAIQLNPILTCDPSSNLGANQWINASCFSAPNRVGQNGPTLLPAIYGPAFFNSDLGIFKNFAITESKKVQFRVQATNFLNHPLWSMNEGNAMNLTFTQSSNGTIGQSNPQFGRAQYKVGQRIVELQVRFNF